MKYSLTSFFKKILDRITALEELSTFDGSYSSLSDKPSTFAPSSHTHATSEVIGLDTALAGKQTAGSYAASTHTHAISDVTNLASSLAAKGILVSGATAKANAIIVTKSATVSSGVAVFHLTADGLSTGVSLFPNGVDKDSVMTTVNDATASYQYGWAFSNSDKTLTVTTNKLTTANILTGLLGQAQANGSVVKLTVVGN